MTSLLTNSSAMTALQTLSQTNKNLASAQNRIATGLAVSTASDNAAYWSIATTMRSDNKALSAVQDALGLGAATIDTMYTGLNGTVEVVSEIKKKLTAARTPGVDRGKIQSEITELQKQLKNTADSSVVNGENWISVDAASSSYNAKKSVVSSFSRAGGVVQIDTINVDLDALKLYDKKADATPATNVVTGDSTGTFAAAAGNITVQVGSGATVNVATTTSSTLDSIAKDLNKLGIDGFTAAVSGSQLTFANRNTRGITLTLNSGLTGPTALATAPTTQTGKGILDKSYDAFDGSAWQTFGVNSINISALTDKASDLATLETYISAVDNALGSITDAATNLGAIKNRIGLQQDFVKTLKDSLDRGIGQLVDADMNAESTRLQALQTQQQLGIQALSIANSGSQSILSLFRG
ncbi:MAG: flagellin [Bosea sp.]|uniref:flagellin N-terminal helical domain-containing protein n=1 Tax=Bosea sp. (in: a-proteobacteria) TaxID=1871050 RepID=UPI00239FCB3E|nr:flagellin [Bosea sp. (in: a-proteobacteria)]MCP4737752.1 flagellin [Bosea sp. (in: a-proteobacteria)]